MNKKTLIYTLVSLVAGGTLTGILNINLTEAQTQASRNDNFLLTQTQPQKSVEDTHHPYPSPSTPTMGMKMNQQQIDQHFIQMMIPHHQDAVDMASIALKKAQHPELKKLAQDMITSQSQEIQEMKTWYKKWYKTKVPAVSSMTMPMQSGTGMNHGMSNDSDSDVKMMNHMNNMMDMDLTALKNASNFDQAFIKQMIPHHKMAVMMAAMVLNSPHPELRNLAKAIIQTQSAEIEEMFQWQTKWS